MGDGKVNATNSGRSLIGRVKPDWDHTIAGTAQAAHGPCTNEAGALHVLLEAPLIP